MYIYSLECTYSRSSCIMLYKHSCTHDIVMHTYILCTYVRMYICRYSVAITKVIGRDLDSIVVDTEKTGKDCIQFMKDQVQF